MSLVIHATTAKHLEDMAANPHHALLLVGANGIGKTALATKLVMQLLTLNEEKLASYPYYLLVQPAETGTLSIDAVRNIQKFLQLKTTGTGTIRRIVCVEHADGLTQEAQNALLKVLEEPPADTIIILTAESKRALLPTILSRVHVLQVHAPPQEDLQTHFTDTATPDDIRKAFFLSGGLPGLMTAILQENKDHPLLNQVSTAKELLQKPTFERLGMIDALTKQKSTLNQLLEALASIAASGLGQAGGSNDQKAMQRWHVIQKEIFLAQDALARSANSKLVLTNMFLHM